MIKNFGTPAHHESNKNAVCRFSTPLPEKSELQIRYLSSVLFYPQNRLYPTIISAAAVITRKKVVGNIKAQVIPKPTQNSMRPHNRFIPILPKRNVYDRLCGLLDNDSQQFCIFPVIMNFTSSRVNFLYQTAFLIERNSIAENLIIAVFKPLKPFYHKWRSDTTIPRIAPRNCVHFSFSISAAIFSAFAAASGVTSFPPVKRFTISGTISRTLVTAS